MSPHEASQGVASMPFDASSIFLFSFLIPDHFIPTHAIQSTTFIIVTEILEIHGLSTPN